MTDHRLEVGSGHQPSFEELQNDPRLLELQLTRIRSEAAAARLEARAAEIELLLRRLSMTESRSPEEAVNRLIDVDSIVAAIRSSIDEKPVSDRPETAVDETAGKLDWLTDCDALRDRLRSSDPGPDQPLKCGEPSEESVADSMQTRSKETIPTSARSLGPSSARGQRAKSQASPKPRAGETSHARPKSSQASANRPGSQPRRNAGSGRTATRSHRPTNKTPISKPPISKPPNPMVPNPMVPNPMVPNPMVPNPMVPNPMAPNPMAPNPMAPNPMVPASPGTTGSEPAPRRSRPGAFFLSAGLHLGLLILLALVSLHTPPPLDQVALTASPTEAEPEPLDSVAIDTSEPQAEPVEPQPTEADVALDPGEAPQPIALESLDSLDTSLQSLASSASSSINAQTLSSSTPAAEKITFCGVEGGGNHFVYLVDCSKSMGSAFESARNELLRSIEALKPDQRFYVIFFDADPDYMRVNPTDADNAQSVLATPQHKLALKQWAMGIKMDRGQAPYEPLEFALELRPDVIFLLSDGEFPAGIETLLRERNRVENLFGENRIRSIIHTIGYHSRAGEVRMRAIAQENQGQYRHVPKP